MRISDWSSDVCSSDLLLQAQGSGAKVIGLANAGGDTVNSIKQAAEFGIVQAGQRLAGMLVFLNDIHAIGLQTAQGLVVTTAFYWDMNDETRAWNERFQARHGRPASYIQEIGRASCRESVCQYG